MGPNMAKENYKRERFENGTKYGNRKLQASKIWKWDQTWQQVITGKKGQFIHKENFICLPSYVKREEEYLIAFLNTSTQLVYAACYQAVVSVS